MTDQQGGSGEKPKPGQNREQPSQRTAAEFQKIGNADFAVAGMVYSAPEAVFAFRPQRVAEIKNEAIFVIDTNALLTPYGTGTNSLADLHRTYTFLKNQGRLVIPGQVAREFAKNRAVKLGELYSAVSENNSRVAAPKFGDYPLLAATAKYQELQKLEEEIKPTIVRYKNLASKILDHIRAWNWDDPVSNLYSELFASGVVRIPAVDQAVFMRDLEQRWQHKIPPGFEDAGKEDNIIGDLMIWQTILEIGRTEKRSVVFVSADRKKDWWHQSKGTAIYPRYELVQEFQTASEGHTFQIILLSELLELFGAEETVVMEVRDEEARSKMLEVQEAGHHDLYSYWVQLDRFRSQNKRWSPSLVDLLKHFRLKPDRSLRLAEIVHMTGIDGNEVMNGIWQLRSMGYPIKTRTERADLGLDEFIYETSGATPGAAGVELGPGGDVE